MQVDGVVRTAAEFGPAGELDLHFHTLLEGVKPLHYLEKAERLEQGPSAAEVAGGNEEVGVEVAAAAGWIQPPGNRRPLEQDARYAGILKGADDLGADPITAQCARGVEQRSSWDRPPSDNADPLSTFRS
jgi:hypothetical protein